MTATLTRPAASIACDGGCGTMLTGGRDTFGAVGENLCFVCFDQQLQETGPVAQARQERHKSLEAIKDRLEAQIEDIEAEIDDARARQSKLVNRLVNIIHELEGRGQCAEITP